jgi:hypothetical protein
MLAYTIPTNRAALSLDHSFAKLRMIIIHKTQCIGVLLFQKIEFRCRLEIYLTDPAIELDPEQLETEVTIRLADRAMAHPVLE